MRLIVNRNWTESTGVVSYRLDFTDEEKQLIEKFNLESTGVQAGYSNSTLGDLIRGVTFQESMASMLLYKDNKFFERCDDICTLLDYCRSFEDEAVIEYPREDESMEVRVRNVVTTRDA